MKFADDNNDARSKHQDDKRVEPLGWRACWYQANPYSGKLVAMSSREMFGTAEAARAFASRMGSTPDAFPVG